MIDVGKHIEVVSSGVRYEAIDQARFKRRMDAMKRKDDEVFGGFLFRDLKKYGIDASAVEQHGRVLKVIGLKDERLLRPSKRIIETSEVLPEHILDVIASIEYYRGIAASFNQFGIDQAVAIFRCNPTQLWPHADVVPYTIIANPSTRALSDEKIIKPEGCLNCSAHFNRSVVARVERFLQVQLSGLDIVSGRFIVWELSPGLLSIIGQHEADHLNGITILDHIVDEYGQKPSDPLRCFVESKRGSV